MVDRMSVFLGSSDSTDANGHILLFGLLTASCFWAASAHLTPPKALSFAVGMGLFLGTATEALQHLVPERGTSLLDWGANCLGAIIFVLLYVFAKSRDRNETTTS